MADLDIKSDTINKGLDIIEKSTKETRNTIDKNLSRGINKVTELLKSTSIGIKIDTYIAERPLKLERAISEMKKKYNKIPDEFKTEPSAYIALKTIQELNYSLDEEHLKKMFQNILISDMDSRNKANVLPGHIEIIKQLSKDDAEMLQFFKNNKLTTAPIIKLKYTFEDGGFIYPTENINLIHNEKDIVLDSIVLDNLCKQRLIELNFNEHMYNEDIYEKVFREIKLKTHLPPKFKELDYSKGLLKITDYGKNFIDICLS